MTPSSEADVEIYNVPPHIRFTRDCTRFWINPGSTTTSSRSVSDVPAEDYFTRSKTRCDAIVPIMPSIVMVLPSALRVVLDVPVPPGPVTEPS
jgi:hypothetical protein